MITSWNCKEKHWIVAKGYQSISALGENLQYQEECFNSLQLDWITLTFYFLKSLALKVRFQQKNLFSSSCPLVKLQLFPTYCSTKARWHKALSSLILLIITPDVQALFSRSIIKYDKWKDPLLCWKSEDQHENRWQFCGILLKLSSKWPP